MEKVQSYNLKVKPDHFYDRTHPRPQLYKLHLDLPKTHYARYIELQDFRKLLDLYMSSISNVKTDVKSPIASYFRGIAKLLTTTLY